MSTFFSTRHRPDCGSCFRENSRRNYFVSTRKNFSSTPEFFTSRTKTKKFTRHVFAKDK
ncbi:DUF1661 domain-containing protein [Porphyromonas gulae]|uniref:DUF1661 domain-containing protein n=1 Tax=Porphyromonas gulae TaxID=111105 RepID=UPI0034E962AB